MLLKMYFWINSSWIDYWLTYLSKKVFVTVFDKKFFNVMAGTKKRRSRLAISGSFVRNGIGLVPDSDLIVGGPHCASMLWLMKQWSILDLLSFCHGVPFCFWIETLISWETNVLTLQLQSETIGKSRSPVISLNGAYFAFLWLQSNIYFHLFHITACLVYPFRVAVLSN